MPKQPQTALEARRWMVANPWCIVAITMSGKQFRWNAYEYYFETRSSLDGLWQPCCAPMQGPFTIIDEPELLAFITNLVNDPVTIEMLDRLAKNDGPQTDQQTGERIDPEWYAETKKQPEWVRVQVCKHAIQAIHMVRNGVAAASNEEALQHICQQAQQVRITWPEWSEHHQTLKRCEIKRKQDMKEVSLPCKSGQWLSIYRECASKRRRVSR